MLWTTTGGRDGSRMKLWSSSVEPIIRLAGSILRKEEKRGVVVVRRNGRFEVNVERRGYRLAEPLIQPPTLFILFINHCTPQLTSRCAWTPLGTSMMHLRRLLGA